MSYLSNISQEERLEMVQKSKAKRQAKREWAEKNLRMSWADESFHRDLASQYGYRLPNINEQASSKFVNRFLKKFNLDKNWYQDHTGFKSGNDESRANPTMTACESIGILLECYHYEHEGN